MAKSNDIDKAYILYSYLKREGALITFESIKKYLLKNSNFPSLTSICNTITNIGIRNKAVKVSLGQLVEMPPPLLLVTRKNDLLIVDKIDLENKKIRCQLGRKKRAKISFHSLSTLWRGKMIIIDKENAHITEKGYSQNKRNAVYAKMKAVVFVSFIILYLSLVVGNSNNSDLAYLGVKLIGVIISILLMRKDIVKEIEYGFCTIGDKFNCDDVLSSKGSRIFSWLSLSEISILYFSSTFLVLTTSMFSAEAVGNLAQNLLAYLTFFSIPFAFFSIYYQGIIIKKWCVLCLAIVFTLLLECAYSIVFFEKLWLNNIKLVNVLFILLPLLLPVVLWINLKERLYNSFKYENLVYRLSRLTNNVKIFDSIFSSEKIVDMEYHEDEIILGNKNSKNVLVAVVDPYCKICAEEYDQLLVLLNENQKMFKLFIRFVGGRNKEDSLGKIKEILLGHYLQNKSNFTNILKDWFNLRELSLFLKTHPIELSNDSNSKMIAFYGNWAFKVGIKSTPKIYFNERVLPEIYDLERFSEMVALNKTYYEANAFEN